MSRLAHQFLFAIASGFVALIPSVTNADTIEVTLVDLFGSPLVSDINGAVNDVRVVSISNDTRVTISGSEVTSAVRATSELGRASGAGNVLTVSFTPPADPVAFTVIARRFDQAQATAAVSFVVRAGSPVQQLTIAVPTADSYRAKQACPPTCRPRCLFRRWR